MDQRIVIGMKVGGNEAERQRIVSRNLATI